MCDKISSSLKKVFLFVQVSVALITFDYEVLAQHLHSLQFASLSYFFCVHSVCNQQTVVFGTVFDPGSHFNTQLQEFSLLWPICDVDADCFIVEDSHHDRVRESLALNDSFFSFHFFLGLDPGRVHILKNVFAFLVIDACIFPSLGLESVRPFVDWR